jgi:hypothetical protein
MVMVTRLAGDEEGKGEGGKGGGNGDEGGGRRRGMAMPERAMATATMMASE